MHILIPLYTGAANSVLRVCDHKTSQVAVEGTNDAEMLPWSFKGDTEDVQITQWTSKVAEEVGRSQITQRRQEEGTRITVVADCLHTIVQRALSDHCGDHCASIWRPREPLSDYGTGLQYASFARPVVSLKQCWWFNERTRVVLRQLHRKSTFWVWATT